MMHESIVLFNGKSEAAFIASFMVEELESVETDTEVVEPITDNDGIPVQEAQRRLGQLKYLMKQVKTNPTISEDHLAERFIELRTFFMDYLNQEQKSFSITMVFNTNCGHPELLRATPRTISKTLSKVFRKYEEPFARMAIAVKLIALCLPATDDAVYVIPRITRVEDNAHH